jgi:mRNA interferase RelE/StbE
MAKFELVVKRKALKEMERLPQSIKDKLIDKIETLIEKPLPRDAKKLEGEDDMFRIRQGDFRAIYSIDFKNHKVTILTVLHRSDAYK